MGWVEEMYPADFGKSSLQVSSINLVAEAGNMKIVSGIMSTVTD
jgi:hypothetical protein